LKERIGLATNRRGAASIFVNSVAGGCILFVVIVVIAGLDPAIHAAPPSE
jgi:hypothetical protein